MNRRKVVDYRILTEFRDSVDRRRLVKALQFVVMAFLKKNPEYRLIGGPYVNSNGLECQAVAKYAYLEQHDGEGKVDLKIWPDEDDDDVATELAREHDRA